MEFLSDSNADKLRYRWEERKKTDEEFSYFFLGSNIIAKANFKVGNYYAVFPNDTRFIIGSCPYGNKLIQVKSYISHKNGTYSRLAFQRRVIEAYDLPKVDKIIILPFEVHTFEDSNKNYISFTFG